MFRLSLQAPPDLTYRACHAPLMWKQRVTTATITATEGSAGNVERGGGWCRITTVADARTRADLRYRIHCYTDFADFKFYRIYDGTFAEFKMWIKEIYISKVNNWNRNFLSCYSWLFILLILFKIWEQHFNKFV